MTKYAAFLRGVNVGGVNLKMADVAKAMTEAGFGNVKTILASGNVLLESGAKVAWSAQEGRGRASRGVRLRRVGTGIRHRHRRGASRQATRSNAKCADHHSYVTFVSDPDVLDELAGLKPGPGETDRARRRRGLLASAAVQDARQRDGQDHGQEALQVVDHYSQPAHAGQGAGR